ncbi:unnamed protein product [Brugia pahangi]|uniref:Secreted protein n=1 Tax=Brugia pahangi TaxID=6280 RepID=A0A0N4SWW3_BRUPA|nr:unnamed protein product [Brugia pahangi]
MLLVTAILVGNDEPQKCNVTHRRDDTNTVRNESSPHLLPSLPFQPCITIHSPLKFDTATLSEYTS